MTNKRRLFVHIGPAKTGTTALQNLLKHHAPAGLLYPKTGQWTEGAHHKLVYALGGLKKLHGKEFSVEAMKTNFVKEVEQSDKDVLISSEALAPFLVLGDAFRPLFAAWLRSLCADVTLIYALRHPLPRASSTYKQVVKDPFFAVDMTPGDFLRDRIDRLMIDTALTRLQEMNIPVMTITYEPSTSFVPRLMDLIGHPMPDYQFTRANESLPDTVLPVMLCANRLFKDASVRRDILLATLNRARSQPPSAAGLPFSKSDLDWLDQQIAKDRKRLEAWGLTYPSVSEKPRFVLGRNEARDLAAFLHAEIERHADHVAPSADPAAEIDRAFAPFCDSSAGN